MTDRAAVCVSGVPVDEVMQRLNAEVTRNWSSFDQPFRLESDGIHWFRAYLSMPPSLLTAEKFPVPLCLTASGAISLNDNSIGLCVQSCPAHVVLL